MNSSLKLRLLLFLVTLSFIATAITLKYTFHREDILKTDGNTIAGNLHKQEEAVTAVLNDPVRFRSLKTVQRNSALARSLIQEFPLDRSIYLFTFLKNQLAFWSANRITPETDAGLREGSNFITWQNGWYEAIKKSDGDFSAVFYIPVKARYPIQNAYLINVFAPKLISSDRLEIAGITDLPVYNVRSSIDDHLLFSLRLKPTLTSLYYSIPELFAWFAAFFSGCLLANAVCLWILRKGYTKLSVITLCVFFTGLRLLTLHHNWFIAHFDLPVFDARYYGSGTFYPSLGDLFLNVFASSWCIIYTYRIRKEIKINRACPLWGRLAVFTAICLFYAITALHADSILSGLVSNSIIGFDVTNILNLSGFSWLGLLILCITTLNLYLLLLTCLSVIRNLELSPYYPRLLYSTALISFGLNIFMDSITIYFILFSIIVYGTAWLVLSTGEQFNPGLFSLNLILFACIASFKLSNYRFEKDREARKVLAQNLEMSDDPNAILYFDSLEQHIAEDPEVIEYFSGPKRDYSQLKNKLQKFYFDGYLTRYELDLHDYDVNGNSLNGDTTDNLNQFKELVVAGTIKVSNYFYRLNNTFGSRHFFAILPIANSRNELGTLVIELTSATFESPESFPRVLADVKVEETDKIRDYSFAFYKDNSLVNQYGSYSYKINPSDYQRQKGVFNFIRESGFDHLIYRPDNKSLIVVSSFIPGAVAQFGSVSFLFLVLLLFSVVCGAINWIWNNVVVYQPGYLSRWQYLTSGGHVLYKTRIQFSIVAAVISTLLIVGAVTYANIIGQYTSQQEALIAGRLEKITSAFQVQLQKTNDPEFNEQLFNGFADVNTSDLNYYRPDGRLLYTTQPKIFETGLVSSRLNALAFTAMNIDRRSSFMNLNERVGRMPFISAYRPVINNDRKVIGYLSLPYFSNEHDMELRIGEFLNTMINVYALVLVGIGFFAVFIANQITYPLTIIQKSLSQIKIGTNNLPISWKRNDEIGSLIREYNTMIVELEESAGRLARSERETAWKEMAKQVAHEIKNPLTPLKLGVQLLDKSWREKDPNFNKKFERFSKSFIEQIESLAHIANEFSNFAKMPETSLENVQLRQLVEQSIEVYKQVKDISIYLADKTGEERMVKGDRDQLLRCFNNLIKNATEAIPESRAGVIRVSLEQRDYTAFIEIADNGKGVPDGLKERIFNPNFTTKSSGTGLGLAFVKQAIENMAGSIRLTTEQDVGTTFYITLPLSRDRANA